MPETRALLDQMIEDNRVALASARNKLDRLKNVQEESNDREDATDKEGLEIEKNKQTNKQTKKKKEKGKNDFLMVVITA